MTAQWYVHDILQPYVLPLMHRLPGAIFQQHNARTQTARVLQDCCYPSLACPIPRLSPIEHIWDHLGSRCLKLLRLRFMYARHRRDGRLTDMFKISQRFTDHIRSDGYSCHQVHFKIDGRVVNSALKDPCSARF
ncbi:transposable element Tcb2 transposase [Trichonephila clavipes]|nr:transposable element Tcb2 transposase [Trichonephila clavipes]